MRVFRVLAGIALCALPYVALLAYVATADPLGVVKFLIGFSIVIIAAACINAGIYLIDP